MQKKCLVLVGLVLKVYLRVFLVTVSFEFWSDVVLGFNSIHPKTFWRIINKFVPWRG